MRVIKDHIEEITIILIILIFITIVVSLWAIDVISDNIADKKLMEQLHEHNEECDGHIHLVSVFRDGYYYECDECYRTFRFNHLLK